MLCLTVHIVYFPELSSDLKPRQGIMSRTTASYLQLQDSLLDYVHSGTSDSTAVGTWCSGACFTLSAICSRSIHIFVLQSRSPKAQLQDETNPEPPAEAFVDSHQDLRVIFTTFIRLFITAEKHENIWSVQPDNQIIIIADKVSKWSADLLLVSRQEAQTLIRLWFRAG